MMNRQFYFSGKFRFNWFNLVAIACMTLFLHSCEKDLPIPPPETEDTEGFMELIFDAQMNGAPVEGYTIFENVNGQRATIESFKFYLGEFSLKNEKNEDVKLKDIAFFDLLNGKNTLRIKLPKGNYRHLKFYAGVPDELNGTNNPNFSASIYGHDHPLSIFNGMYWTWATGYIFLKIEGKIDTSAAQNQTPLSNYFYHIGLQEFYTLKEFPAATFEIKPGMTTKVHISMEYNDFFRNENETINMAEQSFTHTTDNIQLAQKIFSNFVNSMKLTP